MSSARETKKMARARRVGRIVAVEMQRLEDELLDHIETAILETQRLLVEMRVEDGEPAHIKRVEAIARSLGSAWYPASSVASCARSDSEDAATAVGAA